MQAQIAAKTQMTNLDVIKGAIAAKMDDAAFTSWIAPLGFEIVDGVLLLCAQNQFSADFITSVHKNLLQSVAADFGLGLDIVVRNAKKKSSLSIANDNENNVYTPMQNLTKEAVLFDSFVVSEENAFVVCACKKIATGNAPFAQLFLYGAAGCGKTLLTDCIAGACDGRVVKMSGAHFVSEFTRSLKEHNVFAFKDFCRNCSLFILDDVQTLAGKKASTEEFLQLIVDLRNAGVKVVLTSNVAPSNLTGFDRHAQGVLASGLVADVATPNAHVKTVMLQRAGVKATVADVLAARIANDGHLVAGVATKIKTYIDLMGADVDIDVAKHLLTDSLKAVKTPNMMVREMCEKLGVSFDAVCGNGRTRNLVFARQIMMVVLKSATTLSLAEIGNFVGGRDHASVLYAIKQIEKQKTNDLMLAAQIEQFIADCK